MAKSLQIFYGSNTYLRDRNCREALFKARKAGYEVNEVAGDDVIGLAAQLSGISDLFGTGKPKKKLVYINDEDSKLLLAPVKRYLEDDTTTGFMLIKGPAKPKAKSGLAQLILEHPKQAREFVAPPPYKAEDEAIQFSIHEAGLHSKNMTQKTAAALVKVIGTDLGMLAFEIMKASLYLDSLGDKNEITVESLRKTWAPFAEVEVFPLANALIDKGAKEVALLLRRIEDTHSEDASGRTIKVCRQVGSNIMTWMSILHLHELGVRPKDAAERMGMNAYRYEKILLPEAKKAGKVFLRKVLGVLAESEKGVRRGELNPWIGLQTRILRMLLRD